MLAIDGSYGEGGGQILRTALSLSCITNEPFRIFNIRKGRKKPGLMPQHLACIHAMRQISNARTRGDSIGSQELLFEPTALQSGRYVFNIVTAGSTSLLLQAVLLPLVFSKAPSSVTVKGGTHVPFSPPFDYLNEVFFPSLTRLGIEVKAEIISYGFYPRGGGEVRVGINPLKNIQTLNLHFTDKVMSVSGISAVANLPLAIAERQRKAALAELAYHGFSAKIDVSSVSSPGQGTFVFIKTEANTCKAGFCSLGERGKKAEVVGSSAARDFLQFYSTRTCLDRHLADQLIMYLAFAEGTSCFTTDCITKHLVSNLWTVKKFISLDYEIEGSLKSPGKVTITGSGRSLYS